MSEEKKRQLGMAQGTANNKLRKLLMFKYVQKCGDDVCYQCGNKIETIDEFSIEHKIPWLHSDDPVGLYFDLDNIDFSHLKCNRAAAIRRTKHPSRHSYRKGCRCDNCIEAQRVYNRESSSRRRNRIRKVKQLHWSGD